MTTAPPRQSRSQLTSTFDIDLFQAQQARLRQHGKLHWMHWLIVTLSVVITVVAWRTSHSALQERNSALFRNESERVVNLMLERLKHYEDGLLSGVAAMQVQGGTMSREEWRRYAQFLNLPERYPGISGIGVAQYVATQDVDTFLENIRRERPDFTIHPHHSFDLSLPAIYIEPEATNAELLGLDVAAQTNLRSAALRARSKGQTQISAPVLLDEGGNNTPGFWFYAPYYRQASASGASSYTRNDARFEGLVFAPLVMRDLVEGVLSRDNRQIRLKIRDGDAVLFDESTSETGHSDSYARTVEKPLHGRVWTFVLSSDAQLLNVVGSDQPELVLISGLTLDLMLLMLFLMMSRSNQKILSLADEMTQGLSTQALALSESNRDLESFAHVVSHDLKAPIRNIGDLTGFLEEDLTSYLASNDDSHEIASYLNGLKDQVTKSQTLISGILEYSLIGSADEYESVLDTRELVQSLGKELRLREDQLVLEGEFPVLMTRAVLLTQVLSNLIGNGIKYNDDADNAMIKVTVKRLDRHYRFAVSDNGPGIEPRFHQRIFKPFTTLETQNDIHSSGIGLSIVQRAVELQGGTIAVDSQLNRGTTFTFTWPDLPLKTNAGAIAQNARP